MNMNEIDQLTLKLFTNKRNYHQYLSKTNIEDAEKIQVFYDKIKKYKFRIREIFLKYLDCPHTQTTTDVDEEFEQLFRVLIKHFDMKEYENKCARHGYNETDSSSDEDDDREFKKEEAKVMEPNVLEDCSDDFA